MTDDQFKILYDLHTRVVDRLIRIENQLTNKLIVSMVVDISDDKAYRVMQVVKILETSDGVIIQVR